MKFHLIQLIGSIVVMIIGLANLDSTAGKVILALGVLWLINTVRLMWNKKGAHSIVRFVDGLPFIDDLPGPKQIILTAAHPMMKDVYSVFLNNELIGTVTYSRPLTFAVAKQKNVLHVADFYLYPCFFEVENFDGPGQLEMRMGTASPKVVIVEKTGLKPFQP